MSCPRCSSERLYQFEATEAAQPRPGATELPLVCRDCGLITIGGQAVNLPAELEKSARGLAEAVATAANGATEKLAVVDRVETYMSNFFKAAYLEGFFRAIAFFRHNAKEGRLVRLRELWGRNLEVEHMGQPPEELKLFAMTVEAYTEFERLLQPHQGDTDAKSPSNQHPPRPKGDARMS